MTKMTDYFDQETVDPKKYDRFFHSKLDNIPGDHDWIGIFDGFRWVYNDSHEHAFRRLDLERMAELAKQSEELDDEDYDWYEYEEDEEDADFEEWWSNLPPIREVTPKEDFEVNANGGKQSRLETRFDLVPPAALHEVAKTLKTGADKYGERNWRKIDVMAHLNHALEHVNNYRQSHINGTENLVLKEREELAHASTRLLMALEILLVGEDQ